MPVTLIRCAGHRAAARASRRRSPSYGWPRRPRRWPPPSRGGGRAPRPPVEATDRSSAPRGPTGRGRRCRDHAPNPISSNNSSGESRWDRSANSSMTRLVELPLDRGQHQRDGLGDEPGTAAGAVDRGAAPPAGRPRRAARSAGSMLAGWWNSPRVVTTLAPDSSRRHTSSMSQARGMYRTQSAPRARISSMIVGGRRPRSGRSPHSSPASRPTLSGAYTYSPTNVRSGCSMTPRSDRAPMLPVAHWTTRRAQRRPGHDRLRVPSRSRPGRFGRPATAL